MHFSAAHKIILFLFTGMIFYGCTKKVGMLPCNPSYKKDVKPIVDLKCAISGCHVSGAYMGDFTTYPALKTRANNGKIKLLVIDNTTMPLNSSLTEDQIQTIKCWLENGAKNN